MRQRTYLTCGAFCLVALALGVLVLPLEGVGQLAAESAGEPVADDLAGGFSDGDELSGDLLTDATPEDQLPGREAIGEDSILDLAAPPRPPRAGNVFVWQRTDSGHPPEINVSMDAHAVGWHMDEQPIRHEIDRAVEALRRAEGDEATSQAKRKLGILLQQYFDVDMKQRATEIQQIEQRLAKLRAGLEKRQANKSRIIKLQLQVFENEAAGMGLFRTSAPRGMPGGGLMPPEMQTRYGGFIEGSGGSGEGGGRIGSDGNGGTIFGAEPAPPAGAVRNGGGDYGADAGGGNRGRGIDANGRSDFASQYYFRFLESETERPDPNASNRGDQSPPAGAASSGASSFDPAGATDDLFDDGDAAGADDVDAATAE